MHLFVLFLRCKNNCMNIHICKCSPETLWKLSIGILMKKAKTALNVDIQLLSKNVRMMCQLPVCSLNSPFYQISCVTGNPQWGHVQV